MPLSWPKSLKLDLRKIDLNAHLRRIVIVLGSLLVANLVFLIVVNRPRLADVRNADATTSHLEGQVRRVEARTERLREAVENLTHTQQLLEDFFTKSLSTKNQRLIAIQREIHTIAAGFKVQLSQLKFNHEPVKGTDLVRLTVDIPLIGGYINLRQFLNKVEKSNLFLVIEAVQLQGTQQGGTFLSLSVRVASYFTEADTSAKRFRLEG